MPNRIEVKIIFDRDATPQFRYESDSPDFLPGPPATIKAQQGVNMVLFCLESAQHAAFVTQPFQYLEGDKLRPNAPPGISLNRNGDTGATLTDINTSSEMEEFRFFLIILADGEIFADDPTLINLPPTLTDPALEA